MCYKGGGLRKMIMIMNSTTCDFVRLKFPHKDNCFKNKPKPVLEMERGT